MESNEEDRLSAALRRRAARNRREAGLPDPDQPTCTLHELAELMAAEFQVTRDNQDRIEDGLARLVDIQARIIDELTEIRKLLQQIAPDTPAPDANADEKHPHRPRGREPKFPN